MLAKQEKQPTHLKSYDVLQFVTGIDSTVFQVWQDN